MKVHSRAIDEVWYKRAVDYYEEDKEAYVYSVPFDAGQYDSVLILLKYNEVSDFCTNPFCAVENINVCTFPLTATRDPDEVLVTATRAIFIEENNYRKAPAAVVGVTIKHKKFVDFFKNETYKVTKILFSYYAWYLVKIIILQ